MLQKLYIENYAIIDKLEIDFTGKLNIITGETGAGKSILLGALNLVLGSRADNAILQPGLKCIVEGNFSTGNNGLVKEFITANELDESDEIVLRREITANGKSRGFINDTPASLTQLRQLSVLLVDVHQQFDTLEINEEEFQRTVLDALSGNFSELLKLKTVFTNYSANQKELMHLRQLQSESIKEQDYNQFLFEELKELSLQEGELEQLESELKLLSNAENIKGQLQTVTFQLTESDEPLVNQLKSVLQRLSPLLSYHPSVGSLYSRLKGAVVEMQDVAGELFQLENSIHADAERTISISERLAMGYRLQKKHGVNSTDGLIEVYKTLKNKLSQLSDLSDAIEQVAAETNRLEAEAILIADIISKNRKKLVIPFIGKVNELLKQVGMPNAKFNVQINATALSKYGSDEISFMFDANKSGRFEPLKKVASGGELSRLMLVIKSLVASKLEMPTLIFDEIDSGISGEAARQVAGILKELSARHQVITITHQAQIAAKADAHYFIFKSVNDKRIVTGVKLLSGEERINAIAEMLSGEKPSDAAIQNAKEMVSN